MNRVKSHLKMLMALFFSLPLSFTVAGDKPSSQNVTAGIGSYKTQKIHVGLEYSIKYKQPAKGDQVEMVYEFLELNKDLFLIKNPREELVLKYRNDRVVSFQQTYQDIELPSRIKARFSRNGGLTLVEGNYIYDISLSTTPSVDSATAENLALKDLGNPENAKVFKNEQYSTHLSIWKDNGGKLRLIWVLWVRQEYPDWHSWEYYIDAHDGTVLSKVDIIRHDNWGPIKK